MAHRVMLTVSAAAVVALAVLTLDSGSAVVRDAQAASSTAPVAPAGGIAAPAPALGPAARLPAVQARLAALGYLDATAVDGLDGPRTASAVLAFQKWQGLPRDGIAGPATRAALGGAARPVPATDDGGGRRIEILLDRQLVLAIQDGRVVRALPTSTGAAATPTPVGRFRVQAKIERWWSKPFGVWMPWALPFTGGIALHEAAVVPTQPASHGCVRLSGPDARWLYAFASTGDRVTVVARSR